MSAPILRPNPGNNEKVCSGCGGLYPEWWVEEIHGAPAHQHPTPDTGPRFWKAHLPGCR